MLLPPSTWYTITCQLKRNPFPDLPNRFVAVCIRHLSSWGLLLMMRSLAASTSHRHVPCKSICGRYGWALWYAAVELCLPDTVSGVSD